MTMSRAFDIKRAVLSLLAAVVCFTAQNIARAQNDKCEDISTGAVMAYYFDANDKLVAVEGFSGTPRKHKKANNKDWWKLFLDNFDTDIPDATSNGTTVNIVDANTGNAKTAYYVRFNYAKADPLPRHPVCAEDLNGVNERMITTGKKEGNGPVCRCQLVWCGRYYCCPC
jgi:hypothetical protein